MQPASGSTLVLAVVVTYNPEQPKFTKLLRALRPQVSRVVIVDNGSEAGARRWMESLAPTGPDGGTPIDWIWLGENLGIAAAQNAGIERIRGLAAQERRPVAILLMDHDSIPAQDMVAELVGALERLQAQGRPVAAVGANYVDARKDSPPPFIRVRGLKVERLPCPTRDTICEPDYLIASGSLIPLATLDAVGLMDPTLFIDYVDTEWGLRARHAGYQCHGVCSARMMHDLGEEPIRFAGRSIAVHSATRRYYMYRNALLLYRRAYLPLRWKINDGIRMAVRLCFYAVFARPRGQHLRMMTRGIVDGLRGIGGRLRD